MAKKYDDEMVGACPVCGIRYDGRVHLCPGVLPPREARNSLIGAQFVDDFRPAPRRLYGQRLEEGFKMLEESGWGYQY